MNPESIVYVAGHRGLAGSAITRELRRQGFQRVVTRTRAETDLLDPEAVRRLFAEEKPEYVIVAAAKVGGIAANNSQPATFLWENLQIQNNLIHGAWKAGVRKLLFLGSSCIYPRMAPQPIREDALLTGPLEPTNEAYAIAKIAGIKLCQGLRKQHGCDFISAMPTNLYGPGDNYDLETSHVLPAMIHRFHLARVRGDKTVTCWGTGSPLREFLYSDDLARALVFLMKHYSEVSHINVGSSIEIPIRDLACQVADAVGFKGEIVWDSSRPDGTPRKLMDNSRLLSMGWKPEIDLPTGLRLAYADFQRLHQG
jgi:GDP-L-fucose synthase